MKFLRTAPIAIALMCSACAADLSQELDAGPPPNDDDGKIVASDNADQTTTVKVDATDSAAWIYFSFADKDELEVADPFASDTWDLAFRRFQVASNGGVSGNGGVQVAPVPDADFDAMSTAPEGGYLSDRPDSDDEDQDPDLAFASWYNYNPTDHTLSPAAIVYAVRTAAGRYYKVQMLGYYDDAGTSGHPHFRFGEVGAPIEGGGIEADASSHDAWVYLSIEEEKVIEVADPATSLDWDLRIQRTMIEMNGAGGSRWADQGASYDALASSPTIGFDSAALEEWYDYDVTTHTVTPKPRAILLRGARGGYGKLEISSYESGRYRLRLAPLAVSPEIASLEIDASDAAAWVYVDLKRGRIAEVDTATASAEWDLGFKRTQVQTNSGSSGPGEAGAIDPGELQLDAITLAPDSGYATDEMLPLPGPPGSGEFSGNAVLNGWYNYDPITHAVSPKAKAFLLRLSDGSFAKLQIDAFDDGRFTVRWVYAGPTRTSFLP